MLLTKANRQLPVEVDHSQTVNPIDMQLNPTKHCTWWGGDYLPSLTPLSAAGSGRLQLVAAHLATSVALPCSSISFDN